ncbi:uncharacterized protein LOC135156886 [Lytechinus pictus]|uniref:uncharacterized protein LOC135156886 n=1 Tax=Lytechinus pictus TaxID=7653 RepID=UPI0030B9E4D6
MENNPTPFSCDVCSEEFTVKRNLMRHHRMFHHGQRTLYVCDTCGKAFNRQDNLKRHMKTHQDFSNGAEPDQGNQRPTCSQCKSLFLEQKDLDEHMKSHRKETFHCRTCGQIYHNRAKFMKHEKSHHNPVPPKLPKKRVADGPVSNQAKRCRQQPNLALTTVNLPSDIDPESCAAQVYREHWLNIRDRRSFGRVHRFYNYHLPDLNNGILRKIAQKVFEEQFTAFKVNASYGFILCNNETNECRYYNASRNTKILNEPVLISDHSSFQRFMDTFLKEDTLEYARTLRPNSKWVVQHVTNVTFYVFRIADHPIGRGIDLPDYIKNNQAIVSLVKSHRDCKMYDDNLCIFRCLALFQGANSHGLETKAKRLFKQYVPHIKISEFEGIDLSKLDKVEEFFKINIMVYELQPSELTNGDNILLENEGELVNSKSTVAAKLVRRGLDKFPETMYVNLYVNHFSFISDINRYCQNYQCRTCDKLWKTRKSLNRHEKKCTSTATKHTFPTGRATFHNPLTIWEELADEGIFVEEERRYFPYFATFDLESYLERIENDTDPNNVPTDTSRHIPMSMSINSNVPGYTEPYCKVSDGDCQKLIDDSILYLLEISKHSCSLLESSYQDVIEKLDEKIQEYESWQKANNKTPHKTKHLQRLKERFTNHITELPVVGFNSGRYDINAIKQYLYPSLLQFDSVDYVIMRTNNHMALKSKHLQFLDISNFLAPGFSYAAFLKAYDCEQMKGFFPHGWVDCLEKLKAPELPPIETFSNKLNQIALSQDQYEYCQSIWKQNNMTSLRDYLIWYNNLDVTPFIEAVEKMRDFYKNLEIDLFKDGISVPGLTMKYLMKCSPDAHFSVISEEDKDLYYTFRDNLVGGPSIIFHRYHERGVTKIRGGKPCVKIIGFDANALYLHAIMQEMPTGHYVRRQAENDFRPENRHPIAQEWLQYQSSSRQIHIRHAGNHSEKRIGPLQLPVDGFCAQTKQVFEFHGCYFHGHSCHLNKDQTKNTKLGKSMPDLLKKTQEKQEYVERLGYEYISIWECQYKEMRKTDHKLSAFLTETFPPPKYGQGLTKDDLLSAIRCGDLFGFVQCDIHVPDHLREYFSEMCPIFKNVDISREDIGDVMGSYAKKHDIMKTPRRGLIGSMFGKNILLYTPLLRWYLNHGLVVTGIHQFIEYKPVACFKHFGESVSNARRKGDVDPTTSVIADTMKLIGNSSYGKTITNKERHRNVKVCDEAKVQKHINNTLFRDLNPISDNCYEVVMAKRKINMDLPVQIGHAVYHLAKLRMLQFYYDFLLQYVDPSDFQMCEMDTDSAYIAISSDSFDKIIKRNMRERYEIDKTNWFPRNDTQENARYDKRTPGLFKVEWEGDGIIALCSKTYYCFGATDKFSCKGVNKKQNNITKDVYLNVLRSQVAGRGVNKGFRVVQNGISTYSQIKHAFTYFYPKRKVLDDNVSTTYLDI